DAAFDLEPSHAFEQTNRPADIVQNRFGGVAFEQRDVFVRGGVEDDLWKAPAEYAAQSRVDAQVADHRDDLDISRAAGASQFEFRLEDRVLVLVEQYDRGRFERRDLAAQFTADRASRAGDQDALAAIRPPAGFQPGFDIDRIAPQQVFDFDRTQVADG